MLSLILPTYNEAENIEELLPKVQQALTGIEHEIIVVDDDSPDQTWRIARAMASKMQSVHVLRRIGRSGLSSAVVEGFLAAKGDVLAVMDADGQHDLSLLPKMYQATKEADIAIGSRYIEGGSVGEWDEQRYALSRLATRKATRLCRIKVKDPISGFFAIRHDEFDQVLPRLNPKGFKILLDILVHVEEDTTAKELPFRFGQRLHGDSKMSPQVQLQYIEYLYDVTIGRYLPLLFIKYCIVGGLGVLVHMMTYVAAASLLNGDGALPIVNVSAALLIATEVAIYFNYLLNNVWTFARHRLRGWNAVKGFVWYNFACLFGAFANLSITTFLYQNGTHELMSVFIGATVAAVWNYTISRMLTWRE